PRSRSVSTFRCGDRARAHASRPARGTPRPRCVDPGVRGPRSRRLSRRVAVRLVDRLILLDFRSVLLPRAQKVAPSLGHFRRIRDRESALWREPEIGERAVALHIADEPRHLAVADLEQVRSLRPYLTELQPARFAAPAAVVEH